MIPLPEQSGVVSTAPQTEIYLASGIEWDSSYKHVRLFVNRDELVAHIKSKSVWHAENCAPVKKGFFEVQLPINELEAYNADYIMFVNVPYSYKWQFGFITGIEPLSVNSCRIRFELDVWQMSIYDAVFRPSFIERKIIPKVDDIAGNFTLPENLELGDYVSVDSGRFIPESYQPNSYEVLVSASTDQNGNAVEGRVYSGVYTSLSYKSFDITNNEQTAQLNDFISAMTENGLLENIINVTMIPYGFTREEIQFLELNMEKPSQGVTYIPKNKKCLTYPYMYLEATNNNGNIVRYKYEFFSENSAHFKYTINTDVKPVLIAYPINYAGIVDNYESAITYDTYPQCVIAVDAFKAWLAQTSSNLAVNRMSDALGLSQTGRDILQSVTGALNLSGGLQNPITMVENSVGKTTQALNKADGAQGASGYALNTAIGADRIFFYKKSIKDEYLKIVDDYFSMFGYKINRVENINLNNRSAWDFIKTVNINITGSIDATLKSRLEDIFNSGVTIWHNNNIGDYSAENK